MMFVAQEVCGAARRLSTAARGVLCAHAGGGGDFEGRGDTSSSMVSSNLTLSWVDVLPPSSQADEVTHAYKRFNRAAHHRPLAVNPRRCCSISLLSPPPLLCPRLVSHACYSLPSSLLPIMGRLCSSHTGIPPNLPPYFPFSPPHSPSPHPASCKPSPPSPSHTPHHSHTPPHRRPWTTCARSHATASPSLCIATGCSPVPSSLQLDSSMVCDPVTCDV